MTTRSLGHRAPLLWLVLPFMGGLMGGAQTGDHVRALPLLIAAATAAALGLWASGRRPRLWAASVVVAMLLAGTATYALHRARLPAWDALPAREVKLTLRIDRTFAASDARKTSGLATILSADGPLGELEGQRLYFSLYLPRGGRSPIRSAHVTAVGVLVALPRDPPRATFDGYLTAAGMNFRLNRGRILRETAPARPYYRFCDTAGTKFSAYLSRGIDARRPELASVLRAMLLGQKHELSDEQNILFMRSGTMHLFAISGLHIGIIATAVHALLSLLRLPAPARYVAELTALWLYVDITGAAPSAVRAFIMVAVIESALLLRVPRNPLASLATSAFVVLLLWPLQLFSASFQLSYAIVAALLLLGLPLADRWQEAWRLFRNRPKPMWRWYHQAADFLQRELVAALALGIASALVSTVGGLLFFSLFTPGAVMANLVLIPASTLVILAGLASLIAGLCGLGVACSLFNYAAALVLWGIDAAVRAVVAVPGSWHAAEFSSEWAGPGSLLLLLATLVFGYQAGWRRERGGWWPPLVVVAVVLVAGVTFT